MLDGELVVGGGRLTDFYRLAGRLSAQNPTPKRAPVAFIAFDVLWLDERPTIGEPYLARRELLENLGLDGQCGIIPRVSGRGS